MKTTTTETAAVPSAAPATPARPGGIAYCFVTDGRDEDMHRYAVTELLRTVPGAVCVTASDGTYTKGVAGEEIVDCRKAFSSILGPYDPKQTTGRFPSIVFARFILPEITGGRFDRIVYLDNDAIVVSPKFSDIARVDLGACDVGACLDRDSEVNVRRLNKVSSFDGKRYHSASVMVMRGRPNGDMAERVISGYKEYIDKHSLAVPHADVLNLKLNVCTIDCRFNIALPAIPDPNTCCMHMTGRVKTWMLPMLKRGALRFSAR